MSNSAIKARYREFINRTGGNESADTVREFLHYEILRILSVLNPYDLILHGGCKTRYIDGSPRYSMDLDFSMKKITEVPQAERAHVVHKAIKPLLRELENTGLILTQSRERWHKGEAGVKICFKANQLKEIFSDLFINHPGDINFNIDIDSLLPGEQVKFAPLIADRSLQILVLEDSTHMARKAAAVLLRTQLRDLYDLDLYINHETHYDLNVVKHRLKDENLTHPQLIERLCEKIESMDLKARAHQLNLPTEAEVEAFIVTADRIAAIRKMKPRYARSGKKK